MAQLDSDIFLKQSGVDLGNIADGFERGMRIGDLVRQRKAQEIEMQKQNELKEAYNSGYETKEDGTVVLNPMKVSEFLRSKGRAQDAFKFEQDFKQQQAANAESQSKIQSYVANSKFGDLEHLVKNPNDPNAPKIWKSIYDFGKNSGMDMAGYSDIYDPQIVKAAYSLAIPVVKQRELQIQEEKNKIDWAKIQAEKKINEAKGPTVSAGQKAYDTDFAKDANDWTSDGRSQTLSDIAQLNAVAQRLKDGKGTTGGLTGIGGDRLTNAEVLKNRATVRKAALPLIKRFLPGAVSDSDRTEVINTLWNESDSTQNNIDRIEEFAKNMNSRVLSMDAKTKYFQDSGGTLGGFKSPGEIAIKPEDMPPAVDQKIQSFMQKNNIQDKNEAIRILKENGRL